MARVGSLQPSSLGVRRPFEGMRKEHFSWLAANYESNKALLLGMYVGVGEGRPAPKWAPELVRVTSD